MPFNFNDPNEEGFIEEVKVRIEFFNKMFRVYINNAVQVTLYDPPIFDTDENSMVNYLWTVGLTGSTGSLTSTQKIEDWKFYIVKSYPGRSTASLVVPTEQSKLAKHLEAG
jgi:hypothetical protein